MYRRRKRHTLLLTVMVLLAVSLCGCGLQERYESILMTREENAEKAELLQKQAVNDPDRIEGAETISIQRSAHSAGKPYRIQIDGLVFKHPSFAHITIKPAKDPSVRLTCEKDYADLIDININERTINVIAEPTSFHECKAFELVIEADYNELYIDGAMPLIIDAQDRRVLLLTSIGDNNGWLRNLHAKNINCRFRGDGTWQMRGSADDARLLAEGGSVLLGGNLHCDSLNVHAADDAWVEVSVKNRLHAGATDKAEICYHGAPEVEQETVGEARIEACNH